MQLNEFLEFLSTLNCFVSENYNGSTLSCNLFDNGRFILNMYDCNGNLMSQVYQGYSLNELFCVMEEIQNKNPNFVGCLDV